MDTGYDYISPEFLNIILFQQKNLVIFPYVDLKHFHALEVFAVGYNIVDLDSTAIHNIVELLEYESYNSYSQNPTLFFISNVTVEQLKKIMKLDSIHCIINISEKLNGLESRNDFIFFNKKSKKFLNFIPEDQDLDFEEYLIKSSQNKSILQDNILKVKSVATQIFTELNSSNDKKKLIEILSEFDKKYWDKIIQFTQKYYGVEMPDLPQIQLNVELIDQETLDAFSEEYQIIMKSNSKIAQEFIQTLHEYRCRKVNPANLELEQLFKPQALYNYLRNHHWEQGIPEDFVKEWVQMNYTKYPLTSSDKENFLTCLIALNIPTKNVNIIVKESDKKDDDGEDERINIKSEPETKQIKYDEQNSDIPSIDDFSRFKSWILDKLDLLLTELKNSSQ